LTIPEQIYTLLLQKTSQKKIRESLLTNTVARVAKRQANQCTELNEVLYWPEGRAQNEETILALEEFLEPYLLENIEPFCLQAETQDDENSDSS